MKAPTNQHELTLWYLFNKDAFSLREVINDSMFFKFQTRLSELEKEHGLLAKRTKVKFTNRFQHSGVYYLYEAIDKQKVLSIYNLITRY